MKKYLFLVLVLLSTWAYAVTPLPANKVFIPQVKVLDPNTVLVSWKIHAGAYLYKDRIHFRSVEPNKTTLGTLNYPEGAWKEDAVLGRYSIYRSAVSIPVPILAQESGEQLIEIQYQGCTDQGFCYPPSSVMMHLRVGQDHGISGATLNQPTGRTLPPALMTNGGDKSAQVFKDHSLGFILLSFYGFGLLLAFTPCVLPMVPVLSGIIVGHDQAHSTSKAFFLSLSYVLSMAFTYAMAGLLVATLGGQLQTALQEPWVIISFSFVFVLLALSMFGFYDLKLPVSWQAAIAKWSHRQQSGAYLGAAIMGALSTLILSPCVTAPLVGVLAYIANSGDKVLGGLALFSLGLGMGTPLLLVGTAAGHLLPKAGTWMTLVKDFFGWLLLATAIYLLDRIVPGQITLVLCSALFIITAVYLWKGPTFSKGLGVFALIYGTVLLIGAGLGNTNPFEPLENLHAPSAENTSSTESLPAVIVSNTKSLKRELNRARHMQKPVFIDYFANWCVECKIMEKTVLATPEFLAAIEHFQVIKIDITSNTEESNQLRQVFQVIAPPTYLFLDSQGVEVPDSRLVGAAKLSDFLSRLDKTH